MYKEVVKNQSFSGIYKHLLTPLWNYGNSYIKLENYLNQFTIINGRTQDYILASLMSIIYFPVMD